MTTMPRWFRVLLFLYPREFRESHERDLEELYRDTKLSPRTVAWDLLKNALAVHWDTFQRRQRKGGRKRDGSARSDGRLRMDSFMRDLRFAVRSLRKTPTFTLMAAATLAFGIGTNATMFSIVNGVLLKDLPYRDPDRLVALWGTDVDGRFGASEREWRRYREQTQLFDSFGAYETFPMNLTGDDEAVRVSGAAMDAEVLPTLGVTPVLGRVIGAEEDRPGEDDVAVISYDLWRGRFGAEASALGRDLFVNGRRRTIIGVLPEGFRLPGDFLGPGAQVLVPLAFDGEPDPRNIHYLRGIGRLRNGMSLPRAQEQLEALSARLVEEIETLPPTFRATAVALREEILGDVRPALLTLLAAVGLILLIACVNVANLFLARSDARRSEVWIRAALGAGRRRLMGPVLGESLLLALMGGVAGLGFAALAIRVLARWNPSNLPRIDAITLDFSVVWFTGVVATATALLFAIVPALRASRHDRIGQVAGTRTTAGLARQRLRGVLVVGEVALALMLASGAGLLVKSFFHLLAVEPGFDPNHVLTMEITLPSAGYEQATSRLFYRELLEKVRALPGVTSAGAVSALPLASETGDWGVRIEGREEERLASGRRPWAQRIVTTNGYFETLGTRLLEGRLLDATDDVGAQPVVIINETMARRYWPDGSAVGHRFKLSSDIDTVYRKIVGVVADTKHEGLDAEVLPEMYLPHAQFPATSDFPIGTMSLVARAQGNPLVLTGPIREIVRGMDSDVPVSRVASMTQLVTQSTAAERLNVVLFAFFGILALLLVSVGVYGVMACLVSERLHEMGIRMALGARPETVLLSVLGRGGLLALVGISIGMLGTLGLGRTLSGLLFGVSWYDPATLTTIPVIVFVVALFACYFPARRATRVDPIDILRYQ